MRQKTSINLGTLCCTVCLRLCQASAVQRRIMTCALFLCAAPCCAVRHRGENSAVWVCRVGTGIHVDPIRIRSTLHGALGDCQPNHTAYHVHHRSVGDGSLFPAQYRCSGAFASGRSCVGRVGCILVIAPMQPLLAIFGGVACAERVFLVACESATVVGLNSHCGGGAENTSGWSLNRLIKLASYRGARVSGKI